MVENFENLGQLIAVEMFLRNVHKDDKRIERWKGYRDGLRFVLNNTKRGEVGYLSGHSQN